ncbi:hypothetical protein E3P91_03883 [Wallemia ichthyophaga]|nr:hypothetical protein E3P91_03883 [Wallemia ichthyophaga]TIB58497.1 hypothetical protein E3P78_03891 [Wallemia ichthyophaga]
MHSTSDRKSSWTTYLGRLWISLVTALISFLSFSFQLYGTYYRRRDVVVVNILSFFIFYNYFRCTTTDPGGVPVDYEPLRDTQDTLENPATPRYCRSCHVYKPPRAHHCSKSGRCVLRMDHYCPWMNNCIGFYNYGHFIRFLVGVNVGCVFLLYVLSNRVLYPTPVPDNAETALIVANYIACLLTLIVVGSFSLYQFYALCTNTTTIESWEKDKVANLARRGRIRDIKYPYQLSVYENICAVLGNRPWLWLVPQRMHGNGLAYPTATNSGKWVDVHVRGRSILRESGASASRRRRGQAPHAALQLDDGSPVNTHVTPDEHMRGVEFESEMSLLEDADSWPPRVEGYAHSFDDSDGDDAPTRFTLNQSPWTYQTGLNPRLTPSSSRQRHNRHIRQGDEGWEVQGASASPYAYEFAHENTTFEDATGRWTQRDGRVYRVICINTAMIEKKVLVIYTGGTIGMIANANGSYQPHSNLLGDILRSQARFDDPNASSIFSNLTSKQAYEVWNSMQKSGATPARQKLTVRSSSPFQGSVPDACSAHTHTGELETLQTPRTYLNGFEHTVRYVILEYAPLLDSSDVGPEQWAKIASDIELNYSNFDGFVVLHGTDTMSYTASALSFMLEGLAKSVLLTGSQIPLTHIRADASDNILHSLLLAGTECVPEVCIYFNDQLLRGNRSTKVSTSEFDAFRSYNYPPLAKVGTRLDVNWPSVQRQSGDALRVHKSLSPEICVLRFFPGLKVHLVEAILADLKRARRSALVLQSFGSGKWMLVCKIHAQCALLLGNIARNDALLASFKKAAEDGVVIVNTSQCHSGSVNAAYENGRLLAEAGVVPGNDLTSEAALTKLSYLLSTSLPVERVRQLVPVSLRGEVTE